MASYVVKVTNKGTMRRLTLARGEQEFSFDQFQRKIRELFQLPTNAVFEINYIDNDGDVVTMGEDDDLKDAFVQQKLNPLRVTIENLQSGTEDVRADSPVVQNELNSDEVKEDLKKTEGEQTREDSSASVPVVGTAEPAVKSGDNSNAPDDKEWTIIDNSTDSNRSSAASPQSETSVDAKVDPVEIAEPVINSDETSALPEGKISYPSIDTSVDAVNVDSAANAEPTINPGETAAVPEEKIPAVVDEASNSTPKDASFQPSETPVDATNETEGTTAAEDKSPEAEEAEDYWKRQIHYGVRCDSCGMLPIAGPRFKSCKKPNYDLCPKCYEASGDEKNEYVKIDRLFYRVGCPAYAGMSRRPHQWTCRRPGQCRNWNPDSEVKNSSAAGASEAKNEGPGTENSTKVLHQGVQCDECGEVPIEGPRFRSSTRFDYDLCNTCFQKGGSDATEYTRIDKPFTRRGHPMMMPHLLRRAFRHQLQLQQLLDPRWILVLNQATPMIAADQAADEKTPTAGTDEDIEKKTQAASEAAQAQVQVDTTSPASQQEEAATTEEGAEKPKVVQVPVTWADTTQAAPGTSSTPETQNPAPSVAEGDLSTIDGLLAKLAAMGFEDPKLNAELLEKNSLDLRKTLDDLCTAEEWVSVLGQLQEMGFNNANLNRQLMFKHNGSVKRVVKELVQMDRGEKLV